MRLPQRSSKAFTLIELIVVIVILGILALIAIPTFGKVVAKSQDASTVSSLRAIVRDAQALRALDQASAWGTLPADAIGETANNAAAGGTFAAGTLTAVVDSGADPKKGEVAYKVSGDSLVLGALSASGRICIVGADLTTATAGTCVAASSTPGTSTMMGAVNSDASIAPGMVSAPNAPTNVTAAATGLSATVSWSAPVANGAAVTNYTVTASTGQVATSSTLTAQFNNLPAGTPVTFTVKANSASGSSVASAPSNSVTPSNPAVIPGTRFPASTTATATTTYNTSVPARAFDNDLSTSWLASTNSGSITMNFGSALTMSGVNINTAGSQTTSSGTISVDGLVNGTWIRLGAITPTLGNVARTWTVPFNSTTTATALRYNLASNDSSWVVVLETTYLP